MKKLAFLMGILSLSGCSTWNQLTPPEKAGVIVGGTVIVGALIIRNGQGNTQSQCISTRSLETGCPGRL